MTDNIRQPTALVGYPSAQDSRFTYTIGPEAKGTRFRTLLAAIAQATTDGAVEPVFYILNDDANGATYTDDVTLPINSRLVGLDSGVVYLGTITLTPTLGGAGSILENVTLTALIGNYAGLGGQAFLRLIDVTFIAADGNTAALFSAVLVRATNLQLNLNNAIGVDLVAGDAAFTDEGTMLVADLVAIDSQDSNDIGVRFTDSVGGGGDDQVQFQADQFNFFESDGGTGILINNATVQPTDLGDGLLINSAHIEMSGNLGRFIAVAAGTSTHRVGRLEGNVSSASTATVLRVEAAAALSTLIVGSVNLPTIDGGKANWSMVFMLGGRVVLQGGLIQDGTAAFFSMAGGQQNCRLDVSNMDLRTSGGELLSASVFDSNCQASFTDCRIDVRGAGGLAKTRVLGDAGDPGGIVQFTRCSYTVDDEDAFAISESNLILQDTVAAQLDNASDLVQFTVAAGGSFQWLGHNVLTMATGGGGRAVDLAGADVAAMGVGEGGLLEITGCTPAEQLDVATGQQTLTKTVAGNGLGGEVVSGFTAAISGAAQEVIGTSSGNDGPPSGYPGLHIVDRLSVDKTPAGTGDAVMTFENEATGLTGVFPALPNAAYGQVQLAGGAGVLVGPGQPVSLTSNDGGTDTSTDVFLRAS